MIFKHQHVLNHVTLETFRFQDEDENEYQIWRPIFSENN